MRCKGIFEDAYDCRDQVSDVSKDNDESTYHVNYCHYRYHDIHYLTDSLKSACYYQYDENADNYAYDNLVNAKDCKL